MHYHSKILSFTIQASKTEKSIQTNQIEIEIPFYNLMKMEIKMLESLGLFSMIFVFQF